MQDESVEHGTFNRILIGRDHQHILKWLQLSVHHEFITILTVHDILCHRIGLYNYYTISTSTHSQYLSYSLSTFKIFLPYS